MSRDVQGMMRGSARGSFALLIGQVITAVISTITVVWMARYLGPTAYGEYSIALLPVSIALLIQDLGMNTALTRFCALYRSEDRKKELKTVVLTGLTFSIITSVVISALMYIFAAPIASQFLQRPEITALVQAAALAVLGGGGLLTTIQAILVGYEMMKVRSITQIAWSISRTIITVALLFLGMGAFGAVLANTVSQLVAGLFGALLMFYLIKFEKSEHLLNWQTLKMMLNYGLPVSMGSLVGGILHQLYNSLLVLYVATDIIGNFNAAINFGVLVSFLTGPISTALLPLFSKFNKNDLKLNSIYRLAVKYTSMITIPIVLLVAILSKPLSQLIYGNEYPYVALYLSVYILHYAWEGLGGFSLSNTISGIGETKVSLISHSLTFILGAIIAFSLTPTYGALGILIALVLAPRAGWLYSTIWAKKNIGISINWSSSAKIYLVGIFASAITFGLITVFNLQGVAELILGATSFVIIYALGLPMSGALTKEDITEFRILLKGLGPLEKIGNLILYILERFAR